MNNRSSDHGFTLIELLVVMFSIALLLSILMSALGRAREEAMLQKDASWIRSIHWGWTTWASGNKEVYPTPGLVNRLAVLGQQVKGRGSEDTLVNATDNMHSLCVMENLYTPDVLISDSEPNQNVSVKEFYEYTTQDINADRFVDVIDLLEVIGSWGPCS